jgi:hypothetical protein
MARVDFEPWDPPSDERDDIERVARRFPSDWRIAFGIGELADDDCASVVVEDAEGRPVKGGRDVFKSYRFDLVPPFLETLLRSIEQGR